MTDRTALAEAFMNGTDWAGAQMAPLAGDASNRRYMRLTKDGRSAVLMDAPADRGEDVRPFVHIARHLAGMGLSAPRILAEDSAQGFLLLEDLGDDLFARVIPRDPGCEALLYGAATDALAHLHAQPLPEGLARYDPALMADMAALAFEWYAGDVDSLRRAAAHASMLAALAQHAADDCVLIQRDYHAENLLWLPERTGIARVGLLDFQDAMRGHPAYDLVSLLQDARRDVPQQVERDMIARYLAETGAPEAEFDAAYHVLGAQRNLRIIGVFARLCLRDGKAHYIDLIPRVWAYLNRDLARPALADLAPLILGALPEPTYDHLEDLKNRCRTSPTP
ncbi:aminoglycoside phosphotransferase family protein [Roseovarius aquimarinus]|uniref:Aminoglycoside phosphotransferase family protein n=1 Tax=Roseovarius aquimarinus TaxID=1229156 RepID=A0ABW7I8Q3_9RHOB